MCYSATASFTSSIALMAGGSLALLRLKPRTKQLYLAIIPVIFGAHQGIEGIVWLGVTGAVNSDIQSIAIYIYAITAICFWPMYIPFAFWQYNKPYGQRMFAALWLTGAALSVYLLYCLTIYSELTINLLCCDSIAYIFYAPFGHNALDGIYVAVVVAPMLLSRNKRVRYILGPGFFTTFLLALYLQSGLDYPSIWCFFAALWSSMIYYALTNDKPQSNAPDDASQSPAAQE